MVEGEVLHTDLPLPLTISFIMILLPMNHLYLHSRKLINLMQRVVLLQQKKFSISLILVMGLSAILGFSQALAGNTKLSLEISLGKTHVIVSATNNSTSQLFVHTLSLEFDKQHLRKKVKRFISTGQTVQEQFKVDFLKTPGSYALVAGVNYLQNNSKAGFKHLVPITIGTAKPISSTCQAMPAIINPQGVITVYSTKPDLMRLVLPEPLVVKKVLSTDRQKQFTVHTTATDLILNSHYYAVEEEVVNGHHTLNYCRGSLKIHADPNTHYSRGRLSNQHLQWLGLFFIFLFITGKKYQNRLGYAVVKYAARILLLVVAYLLLKNATLLSKLLSPSSIWLPNHFSGNNFGYFFIWFLDGYFLGCLLLSLPYSYWMNHEQPLKRDKYATLVESLGALLLQPWKKKYWNWSTPARLGGLTVLVKLFFGPYLISWVINNTVHQNNLLNDWQWNFQAINIFITALFIYLDTIVFTIGYYSESPKLKNQIRSVEPTLLGWVVCLWCYPPFNHYSFRIFDHRLFDFAWTSPVWLQGAATLGITILWGIFCWASLSLGFKASNLTNRGIVNRGPYKFVRHPAYSAKIGVWLIQTIVFGQFAILLFMGFTIIYGMRAWTEERHLSLDPEYLEYKKQVPWKVLPRLF
ncbi:MAG: isoprenylcysteine carboxylmethyltransferase family protein [Magnetococcales bacterium]|nr:isoprenylcysteine carboxylmethyltransferase family protein [Magnetococcales bacterium]